MTKGWVRFLAWFFNTTFVQVTNWAKCVSLRGSSCTRILGQNSSAGSKRRNIIILKDAVDANIQSFDMFLNISCCMWAKIVGCHLLTIAIVGISVLLLLLLLFLFLSFFLLFFFIFFLF